MLDHELCQDVTTVAKRFFEIVDLGENRFVTLDNISDVLLA